MGMPKKISAAFVEIRKEERMRGRKNGKNEDKRRKECIKQHRHTSIRASRNGLPT